MERFQHHFPWKGSFVSLNRLIFYSAMIGGWAAFVGWLLSEILFFQRSFHEGFWGFLINLLAAGIIGGCIAGGLTLLGGLASGTFKGQILRFFPVFLGRISGRGGRSLPGNSIYLVLKFTFFQILGWTMMGLAIGAVEGLYDRSPKKLRNGLLGGGIGGFLGGIIFNMLGATSMAERATGFVMLGMCIGCFIGLAQVILKEAWLTVENGFRPGRQLVLNMPEIIMGTSEKAALPFIAFGAKGVEPIHLRIVRQADGSYVLQDNHSRTGTFLNGQHVQGAVVLKNNDAIQLGVNVVRFRERHRQGSAALESRPAVVAPVAPKPPPVVAVRVPAGEKRQANPTPTFSKAPPPPPSISSPKPAANPVATSPPPVADKTPGPKAARSAAGPVCRSRNPRNAAAPVAASSIKSQAAG